jgi:histidine triad (HIT) family protein
MPNECLFCRIIAKEIPVAFVAETDQCVAFRDINPQAPLHVLVVPREHIANLNDATDPLLLGRMTRLASEIAAREGVADRGYRTVMNTNADGGQTVGHIHLHLLGGRAMHWPPG